MRTLNGSWSPDGTKIVFAAEPPRTTLMVVNADGTNLTEIGPGSERAPTEPEWQPTISLALAAAPAHTRIAIGASARWTVTVRNTGPRTATGVTVAATLTSGRLTRPTTSPGCTPLPRSTCKIGDLPPGTSATISFTARPAKPGKLALRAMVAAIEADNAANDDTATATVAATTKKRS